MRTRSYKALGLLLTYPTAELQAACAEIPGVLKQERVIPRKRRKAIEPLVTYLRDGELLQLQEAYTALFDRSRRVCLHLYEHYHGESRDRGKALVRLQQLYEQHGLEHDPQELPDYLPMVLEFLALLPPKAAKAVLGDAAHILAAIHHRLGEMESRYAPVLGALVDIADTRVNDKLFRQVLAGHPADETSYAALDAEWAEDPVTFGAGSDPGQDPNTAPGCSTPARPQ